MFKPLSWLDKTRRHVLPNGLTVLTYKIPGSNAASLHFCVKAGYFCETDAEVGLAHLLEHMYFKGSEAYPAPGIIGILMKSLGGSINATTSYDQTNYFCEVPAHNLLPALRIMADAFGAPIFPADELAKESEVVIEEFNRKLDSPAAYSQEKLIQLAFTTHRMKRWRIGTPEQLRTFTRDDLFDYFHRYYQPQNMIVTVCGNIEEEETVATIADLFRPIKNRELQKDFGPEEPAQNELRYAQHTAAATNSYLHFGFHAPGVTHPDGPTLELLAFLLSAGRSARLHRYVVEEKRSASTASCGYASYEDIGLILISAVTEAEKIRHSGSDIWAVLEDLFEHGIAQEELSKVRNKLRLHEAMQTEEVLNLAQILSYNEAYGGYERIREYFEKMEAATEEQILMVARKYFTLTNLSVLELVNQQIDKLSASSYEQHLIRASGPPEAALVPGLLLQEADGVGAPTDFPEPIVLTGKPNFIFHPDSHYPFLSAGIFFNGGRNEESDSTAGLTHLLFRTALKGTSKFDAEEIAFRFDALGNPPRVSCHRDYGGFVFETLPYHFLEMWNLLVYCLTDSIFPEKEVETERDKMIANIHRNMDDNFVRPLQLFQRGFYGSHPYGLPEQGFEETVNSFRREDLLSWKTRVFDLSRANVLVVGSFNPEVLKQELDSSLQDFPISPSSLNVPTFAERAVEREVIEHRPKKQTAFVLGFPAPSAIDSEIHKYEAMQQILTGMGGRLFLNLRSKKSLAYTVHAGIMAARYSGSFLTYIAGEAAKENDAIDGMWQELRKMKESEVTQEELQNARNALIGGYSLNTQAASSRVFDYQNTFALGRPLPFLPVYNQFIENIKAEDILNIAQKTFQEENSTIAIVRGTTEKTDAEKVISGE